MERTGNGMGDSWAPLKERRPGSQRRFRSIERAGRSTKARLACLSVMFLVGHVVVFIPTFIHP